MSAVRGFPQARTLMLAALVLASFPPVMVRSVSPNGAALIHPDSQSLPDEAPPAGPVHGTKDGTTFVKRLYLGEAGLMFHNTMAKKKPVGIEKAAGPQPPIGGGQSGEVILRMEDQKGGKPPADGFLLFYCGGCEFARASPINFSISSGSRGSRAERIWLPSFVTRTSSSMRTPRFSSGI